MLLPVTSSCTQSFAEWEKGCVHKMPVCRMLGPQGGFHTASTCGRFRSTTQRSPRRPRPTMAGSACEQAVLAMALSQGLPLSWCQSRHRRVFLQAQTPEPASWQLPVMSGCQGQVLGWARRGKLMVRLQITPSAPHFSTLHYEIL